MLILAILRQNFPKLTLGIFSLFFPVLSLFEDLFVTERWKKIPYLWKSSACMHAKSLQLCLTLCDPMDCSLPGFSVYGILQARIMEWVAISFSRGSSRPRDHTLLINYILWKSCLGIQFLVLSTWYGNFLCYKIKRKA